MAYKFSILLTYDYFDFIHVGTRTQCYKIEKLYDFPKDISHVDRYIRHKVNRKFEIFFITYIRYIGANVSIHAFLRCLDSRAHYYQENIVLSLNFNNKPQSFTDIFGVVAFRFHPSS